MIMPTESMEREFDIKKLYPVDDEIFEAERESISAPTSRSNSWKNKYRGSLKRERRQHSNLCRTNSASTPDCSDTSSSVPQNHLARRTSSGNKDNDLCTVLSFKTTAKGRIINSGIFNKSLSSNSLLSSGSLAICGNHSSNSSGNNLHQDDSNRQITHSKSHENRFLKNKKKNKNTNNTSKSCTNIYHDCRQHRSSSVDKDLLNTAISASLTRGNWCYSENNVHRLENQVPYTSMAFINSYFRTVVLGAPGVGKSSVVRHFTRSPSLSSCPDDDSNRQLSIDPLVTVDLDGQESTMEFIDGPEITDLDCYRADAFIILYAVSEMESFTYAMSLLNHLRQDLGSDRPIYVVGNKTDLARHRLVTTQHAKTSLTSQDCHFLEMSTALNVNLDQLLVGILCKIKQKLTPLTFGDIDPSSKAKLSCKRRSSPGALAAISNFFKHACKRESKNGRNSLPVWQVV